ncbi:hypothetical protein K5D33_08305 [Pseudomonas cichorii]|nr:hypothetical protein [Pseudomonas cichorii]MBX8518372.1 hypothetical protein [Pseudomonas cichorii]MBX8534724.1 hypothetical protein [Pseudomonas cichorii]MBX8554407.1 hypothetical protein [Pseudomonas cichorii]
MKAVFHSLLVACAIFMSQANAHGAPQPQHGGLIEDAGLVAIEMVTNGDTVDLYLTDHDQPISAENVTGVLTITTRHKRVKTDIVALSGNQLQSKGVSYQSGSRISALLTLADGKTKVSARFKIP